MPKKKGYLSILEHEFVHVNQMISVGHPPDISKCGLETEVLFEEFCKLIRYEYEAHIIQLTKDSTLFPQYDGLTLAEWCCLCGYTTGLENILLRFILEKNSLAKSKAFFKKIEVSLPEAFSKLGLDKSIAKDFVADLKRMRAIALECIYDQNPGLVNTEQFKEIGRWMKYSLD